MDEVPTLWIWGIRSLVICLKIKEQEKQEVGLMPEVKLQQCFMIANLKDSTAMETVRLTYRGLILSRLDKKGIGYTKETDICKS